MLRSARCTRGETFIRGMSRAQSNWSMPRPWRSDCTYRVKAVIVIRMRHQRRYASFRLCMSRSRRRVPAMLVRRGKAPVIFGVLTVENLQQATRPGRSSLGNKGAEAAVAAIRMANLHATSYAMPLTASAAAASTVATTVVAAASPQPPWRAAAGTSRGMYLVRGGFALFMISLRRSVPSSRQRGG